VIIVFGRHNLIKLCNSTDISKSQGTNFVLDTSVNYQILAYAGDVNLIGDDIRTIKKVEMCYQINVRILV
jgi:hypothetical protein